MNQPRPHAVFDCNVLLQAVARSTGPAAQCLRLVEHNDVTLFLCKKVIRELRQVLAYPEIRERNPHLTDAVIKDFISHLIYRAILIRDVPRVVRLSRDSTHEPYLDLAAAVSADFLVSRDKDLLSLNTDHSVEAKQFRQRFPFLHIVAPAEFLAACSPAMPPG